MRTPITYSVTASGSDQGGSGCRALTSARRACSVWVFRIDMDLLLYRLTHKRSPSGEPRGPAPRFAPPPSGRAGPERRPRPPKPGDYYELSRRPRRCTVPAEAGGGSDHEGRLAATRCAGTPARGEHVAELAARKALIQVFVRLTLDVGRPGARPHAFGAPARCRVPPVT